MKKLLLALFALTLLTITVAAQTDVEPFIEKAGQFAQKGKIAESVDEITKAIAVQPANADLYLRRANYYMLLDDRKNALADAQKAASLSPTDKKILYFAALEVHKTQQYGEALKIIEALFALGDADRFAWGLRIQIKMHLEDFAGAYEDATAAVELFPDDNVLRQNQANLIRLMGDSEKALEIYNKLIPAIEKKLNNENLGGYREGYKRDLANMYFSRASLHFNKINKEQALADLDRAVSLAPKNFGYYRRAQIYRDQKMYTEAINDLTKAIDFGEKSANVMFYIERGDIYFYTRKFPEAISDYEEAAKLDKQVKEPMKVRIDLAKQKMQENK